MSYGLYSQSATARSADAWLKALNQLCGGGIDMKSAMCMATNGKEERVLDCIAAETGISKSVTDNQIDFNRYVSAENQQDNYLFQGNDQQIHNINFAEGTYSSQSERSYVAENFGGMTIDGEKGDMAYDIVKFGNDKAEFINYAATGYDDGCDRVDIGAKDLATSQEGLKWGNKINFSYREINPNNPSSSFISDIMQTSTQWLSSEQILDLQQQTTYESYIQKLIDAALKVFSSNDEGGMTESEQDLKDQDAENVEN